MDVSKLDLYEILDIPPDATEKEIVKAYRKKALKWHPDKNPDNPLAADKFHQLSKALEILTDSAAKAAYDKILKAKEAAKVRHRELDSKRKKFKEDLEARENAAESQKEATDTAARNLQAEIERLREQGCKLLEEEQARLHAELAKEKAQRSDPAETSDKDTQDAAARLKLRWKAKKSDDSNGGYNSTLLQTAFSKYGEITALLVSQKKKGSAIVEFRSTGSAVIAQQNEIGLTNNPLTVTWLSGQPSEETAHQPQSTQASTTDSSPPVDPQTVSDRDFESIVLMNMRRAQEKKRLMEEIQRQDEQDKAKQT